MHVGESNVRVIQGYEPASLAAPVYLFVPAIKGGLAEVSGRDMPNNEDHGWSTQVGQPIDLHLLPGDHFTMMVGEGAAQLASQLAKLMRESAAIDDREREPAH